MNENVNKFENNKRPSILMALKAMFSSDEDIINDDEMREVEALKSSSDKKIKALESRLSSSDKRKKMVDNLKVSGTVEVKKKGKASKTIEKDELVK